MTYKYTIETDIFKIKKYTNESDRLKNSIIAFNMYFYNSNFV